MTGEDFFKFNNGKEFRFSNFKDIKEEDLKGADEKTKKLFNIFAGEDKVLQESEAKGLFEVLKSAAGENNVLEENEISMFAKEKIGEEIDTNIFINFINNIFKTETGTQEQGIQAAQSGSANKQEQATLGAEACKEITINMLNENVAEAYKILNSQELGAISGLYDEGKDNNDILKTSNVTKVLEYQDEGVYWMKKAKLAPPNGLTKKEYYEGNKQRIKDMILTRVMVLDTNTKFKELKNKYSEEELARIIGEYVEARYSNAPMEDLKGIQKHLILLSGEKEVQALESFMDKAIEHDNNTLKQPPLDKNDRHEIGDIIPEYWNKEEPISFEEVYEIERGAEYSQYKIEKYVLAKKEMETVAGAYNKKQQFVEFAEGLRKDESLSIEEKSQKVLEGFADFYALSEDGGLSQLKELINEAKLPISVDANGFDFGALDDEGKNRALNSLLKFAKQSKEAEFEKFLNGKTIEDYQNALTNAQNDAIGLENGQMMAVAMKNDNLNCIQRWTGNTSMVGMGMTVVGGILCFTPLAPLGAGMITFGNTLAVGGMVAETGLGVADYATKDVQTAEEAKQLSKNFIMNAGGFIIGMGAGKAGLKTFNKLIDEKLAAVFKQQIAAGNKAQALKTVFKNPEYLKSFMTAAGAKLSTDFVISYAGDLAMMGILDTDDDWQSLLRANLTGILVGMSGDIKDISGAGRPRNFGVSDGVKPTAFETLSEEVATKFKNVKTKTEKRIVEKLENVEADKLGVPAELKEYITKDNIDLARDLLADKNFTRDQIMYILSSTKEYNVDLARELLADENFPRDQISDILYYTNKDNVDLARELLADENIPKGQISNILYYTNKDNVDLARELLANKNIPKGQISKILGATNKDNVDLARELLADENFPKDQIRKILGATNEDNVDLVRKLVTDETFPVSLIGDVLPKINKDSKPLANLIISRTDINNSVLPGVLDCITCKDRVNQGNTDTNKVNRYTALLTDPKTSPFMVKRLNEGMDIDTAAFLIKTQRKLNTEKTQAKLAEQKANISNYNNSQQSANDLFKQAGLNDKEAAAVIKAISNDGVIDKTLQDKAVELIHLGIAKNKIGDILNSAKITGEYNPKIVDDFVTLQGLGLNPLLEKNLAIINNISGNETANKFNSKVKKQLAGMIENLSENTKILLASKGFDTKVIIEKLNTKQLKVTQVPPQKIKAPEGMRVSKSKLSGFEKIVVEKYNPDQKIWMSEANTKKWAEDKYNDFKNGDYESRTYPSVNEGRQKILKEWFDFMDNDPDIKDNPFVKIVISEYIVKELAPENAWLPPAFDRAIAKEVLNSAMENQNVSISSAYSKRIRAKAEQSTIKEEVYVDGIKGTWYTVPQTDKSSPDYQTNVNKIRAFSDGTNWCIKTNNAEPYVQQGAMHFFVDENGLTQVCVREDSPGKVYEIQKRQQNGTRPIPYIMVVKDYLDNHNLRTSLGYLDDALAAKPKFDAQKKNFNEAAQKGDYKYILEQMGITVETLPDGTYAISHYNPSLGEYAINDLGIKEDDLLVNVSVIKGDAVFENSNATVLPNLREVGGRFTFDGSNLTDIRNLKAINGYKIEWE